MHVCWSHANVAVIEKCVCVCDGGGGVGTNTRVSLGAGVAG